MKINKEIFKESALSLHFALNDHELDVLHAESENLLTALEGLANFNTNAVEPMHYSIPYSFSTLREDKAIKIYDSANYLKNAKNRFGKYIVVK
ncbi:MAG: hypothetical protein LBD63_00505 [Mycoplasmataceae bacterium]|jgi:aspartyl/glutamyl-tRNA(Asn/Gln) amidotransferase C subunit|nr:hypothetical protein [Mycoplasmataceae bacterium]